jgi:hypothetical protein
VFFYKLFFKVAYTSTHFFLEGGLKKLLLLCWGYIVLFTKVLTICQIYHNWIHPSIILLYSPLLPFLEEFQQVSFFCSHTWGQNISTTFTMLHTFLISSPLSLLPSPRQDLFYFLILHFLKKDIFCLFKIAI